MNLGPSDFLNPVSAAIEIINEYRASIQRALIRGGLDEDQARMLLKDIRVSSQSESAEPR